MYYKERTSRCFREPKLCHFHQNYYIWCHTRMLMAASLYHHFQTESGAHPASYPMGTSGSFPGGKAVGARS
jgi:hypothetical protein